MRLSSRIVCMMKAINDYFWPRAETNTIMKAKIKK